ncbi:MAG: SRPBCC family protein [Gemmatimonadota bacterium]
MTTTPGSSYVYVTYIRTTQERLWDALTTPEFIRQYWFGVTITSDFRKGSPWKLELPDGTLGDSGQILESDPPRRLVIKWRNEWKPELKDEGYSRCVMELEPSGEAVKLTITHGIESGQGKFIEAVSGGWPKVLSNLKSLLESGKLALTAAY